MGWFNEDDTLINPPGLNEVLDISALMSSEGGSVTVMDFHVTLALYETADDIEVLCDLPQKLLFKLHVHVDENISRNTNLTKPKLIKRLENAVISLTLFWPLGADSGQRGRSQGLWTLQGS